MGGALKREVFRELVGWRNERANGKWPRDYT